MGGCAAALEITPRLCCVRDITFRCGIIRPARVGGIHRGDTQSFPWETRLHIYYQRPENCRGKEIRRAMCVPLVQQTLRQVNGSVVRLSVFQGEYHWHNMMKATNSFTWSKGSC